jgi:hypothetical protein
MKPLRNIQTGKNSDLEKAGEKVTGNVTFIFGAVE